jgi:aryl-alcohol dehydrogenase-like predicted oxidoreductase
VAVGPGPAPALTARRIAGIPVSRVGFGCEQLGGTDWGRFDREETKRAVGRAVELGINVFDTADVYSLGESERCLAAALGPRRHEVFIVTKGGVRWDMPPGAVRARCWFDLSPDYLRSALEDSLRRLDVAAIPLYLLHAPDPAVPLERTLEAVVRLKEAGKIRAIGLSNFPLELARRAAELADLAAVQLRYNLLERAPENGLLPWCRERGIAVLAYGPLAEGLLAGKYSEATRFDADDRRSRLPHFQGDAFRQNLVRAARVRQVADAQAKTPVQVAVNWVLGNDAVTTAIVGIKTRVQVEDVAGSVGWTIDRKSLDG